MTFLCQIRKPGLENQNELPETGHQNKVGFEPDSKSPSFKSCWGGGLASQAPGPPSVHVVILIILSSKPSSHSPIQFIHGCMINGWDKQMDLQVKRTLMIVSGLSMPHIQIHMSFQNPAETVKRL